MEEQPDWVVVVGDVNATLACSVTAKKLNVRVCHIEAGLRSGDMQMPEEINRLVTDRLADLLLVPDRLSEKNLLGEGCTNEQVVMVGNIMIDTFDANHEEALAISKSDIINRNIHSETSSKVVLEDHNYAVVTLHRPSNVDDKETLKGILDFFANGVAEKMPVIWPVHPRTEKQLKNFNLWDVLLAIPNIQLVYPLSYHDMLQLNMNAKVMLTDSGGLQEECTVLGTKCITMRWNTERPITLKEHGGVSVLVGNNLQLLEKEFQIFLKEDVKAIRPEMWDGKTALRCVNAILKYKY
jgi:UDP-N-acetylglucosamine 2-epimerase (non-hydrolysing)